MTSISHLQLVFFAPDDTETRQGGGRFPLLTKVEVVVVIEAQPKVYAGVAQPRALVRADIIGAPSALLVRAAARDDPPPAEVVDQRRPCRSVQPHLG